MRPAVIWVCVALGGCASYRQELSRFDGQPLDPVETERVKVECAAAGQTAAAGVGWQGPGMAGALTQGIAQAQANTGAYTGCMARNGIRITMIQAHPASP